MIRRDTFDHQGNHLSKEIVHGVTSLTAEQATPEVIARLIRQHWGIENKIHWVTLSGGKTTGMPTRAQAPRSWPPYETWPLACYAWPESLRSNAPSNASPATERASFPKDREERGFGRSEMPYRLVSWVCQGDPQSRFRMSVAGGRLTGPGCLEAAGLRREPGTA